MLRPFPTQKVEIEMERQFKLQNFNSKPKHNAALYVQVSKTQIQWFVELLKYVKKYKTSS